MKNVGQIEYLYRIYGNYRSNYLYMQRKRTSREIEIDSNNYSYILKIDSWLYFYLSLFEFRVVLEQINAVNNCLGEQSFQVSKSHAPTEIYCSDGGLMYLNIVRQA